MFSGSAVAKNVFFWVLLFCIFFGRVHPRALPPMVGRFLPMFGQVLPMFGLAEALGQVAKLLLAATDVRVAAALLGVSYFIFLCP